MLVIQNEGQLKATTGLSEKQFDELEEKFGEVYEKNRIEKDNLACESGLRKRRAGGGRKSKLDTTYRKLLFILFYLKAYPTFQVLGATFGLTASRACQNVHQLLPILHETLAQWGAMPHRNFANPEEMQEALKGVDKIIIDAVERNHHREEDNEKQKEKFSGKKKRHTVKNTIISDVNKKIIFVGATFPGSHHDYSIFKEEFPPEQPWLANTKSLVDLGYQGIRTGYEGEEIHIPNKKPRKSKNNPEPKLTQEQKDENRALSRVRVLVEHAIGGMKRYNILVQVFRNRIESFSDDVVAVCAALWNFFNGNKVTSSALA